MKSDTKKLKKLANLYVYGTVGDRLSRKLPMVDSAAMYRGPTKVEPGGRVG